MEEANRGEQIQQVSRFGRVTEGTYRVAVPREQSVVQERTDSTERGIANSGLKDEEVERCREGVFSCKFLVIRRLITWLYVSRLRL